MENYIPRKGLGVFVVVVLSSVFLMMKLHFNNKAWLLRLIHLIPPAHWSPDLRVNDIVPNISRETEIVPCVKGNISQLVYF